MFNISKSSLNMGHTMFENIFITDYLPYAEGDFVKVYLLGYHFAAHNQQHLNLLSISMQLDMPIKKVFEAFEYWKEKGLVDLIYLKDEENTIDNEIIKDEYLDEDIELYSNISVEFFSINDMYIIDNYKFIFPKEKLQDENSTTNDTMQIQIGDLDGSNIKDDFIDEFNEITINDEFIRFKEYVEKIRGKGLTEIDIRAINKYSIDKKMDYSLIKKAFEIAYIESNIKSNRFAYMLGILNRWYDDDILSLDKYHYMNKYNYKVKEQYKNTNINSKYKDRTKRLDSRSRIHENAISTRSKSSSLNDIINNKKESFREKLYKNEER